MSKPAEALGSLMRYCGGNGRKNLMPKDALRKSNLNQPFQKEPEGHNDEVSSTDVNDTGI